MGVPKESSIFQDLKKHSGLGKMHLDLYTSNSALTHKAKFWCNYVGALKGSQDLRAPDDRIIRSIHPSIVETLPEEFPDLKHEFSRLESQMFARPKTESTPSAMPTTPSTLKSMAHSGTTQSAQHCKLFSFKNQNKTSSYLLFQNKIKKNKTYRRWEAACLPA